MGSGEDGGNHGCQGCNAAAAGGSVTIFLALRPVRHPDEPCAPPPGTGAAAAGVAEEALCARRRPASGEPESLELGEVGDHRVVVVELAEAETGIEDDGAAEDAGVEGLGGAGAQFLANQGDHVRRVAWVGHSAAGRGRA